MGSRRPTADLTRYRRSQRDGTASPELSWSHSPSPEQTHELFLGRRRADGIDVLFIAYLIVLFQVIVDLFRDSELGGGSKVLWIIGLIFVPLLTALIYVLARGSGMAARQRGAAKAAKAEADAYIRDVAGKSPADHIADAKKLLDAGTINADEYARLKAKALA